MDSTADIRTELTRRLLADAATAVDGLNAEGADDVYGVAVIANAGFFSGLGLVSNTVTHLTAAQAANPDDTLSPVYFELSAAEWNRYEWAAFAETNGYLAELEDRYYEDELPFDDDGEFAELVIATVIEVLRSLDLRQRVVSRHAGTLYVGLAYADPGADQRAQILTVAEALNDEAWLERLRALHGSA